MNVQPDRILRVARLLVNALAISVALAALYVLIVGQQFSVIQESPLGEINSMVGAPAIQHAPYPPAVLFLLASLALLIGNLRRLGWLTWSGLGALPLVSVLFLFSSGAAILPIALVILILLFVIHWAEKTRLNRQGQ